MHISIRRIAITLILVCAMPSAALAWGGLGHRTVAAVAMSLLPSAKAARIDAILHKLEIDQDFVDSASYPDEYIRDHDPGRKFSPWHFADLPDDNSVFDCKGKCLFTALNTNLTVIQIGADTKADAVALAWVIHLVGDMHQPLHMSGRDGGGNGFPVTYRGQTTCLNYSGKPANVELHSVWDDCLVEELANGRTPQQLAHDLLGGITTYKGRSEIDVNDPTPWNKWGDESHTLANSVAFDSLKHGDDLGDAYIQPKALSVVEKQLLVAGIRLAYLLDENFPDKPKAGGHH